MFFNTQGCTRREEQSLEDKQKAPLSAELQTLNIPKKGLKTLTGSAMNEGMSYIHKAGGPA